MFLADFDAYGALIVPGVHYDEPVASSGNKPKQANRQLPWPLVLIVASMVLLGAITLLQWVLNTFATVLKVSLMIVVMVALTSWVYSAVTRR